MDVIEATRASLFVASAVLSNVCDIATKSVKCTAAEVYGLIFMYFPRLREITFPFAFPCSAAFSLKHSGCPADAHRTFVSGPGLPPSLHRNLPLTTPASSAIVEAAPFFALSLVCK